MILSLHRGSAALATVAALTALVACGGSPTVAPTTTPTTTATATDTPTSTPAPGAGPRAVSIAYADRGDLWVYDVAADAVRRLTGDGEDVFQTHPRWRDSNTVSYLQDGVIFDRDTGGGAARRVFGEGDGVRAFDWSPDGASLAAIVLRGSSWRLSIVTPSDGRVRDVKTISVGNFGRGGVDDDEISVAWSPDGTKIVAVDTGALESSSPNFNGDTMLVVSSDGAEPVPRRRGTFARWSPDGSTIYYTDFMGGGRLSAVDVASGTVTPLAATAPVRRPVPAQAGALIAFDDGNAATATLVFNAATGATRRAGAGVGPLWLGADLLLVSDAQPCTGDACFEAPPWTRSGTTTRLPLDGTTARATATSTLDADVRYV